MELLAILIGWIVFSYAFAELAPALAVGAMYLIGYVLLAFWVTLKFIAKAFAFIVVFAVRGALWVLARLARDALWIVVGIARGVLWVPVRLVRGAAAACVFLFFLVDEWRRGPSTEPNDAGPDDYGDEGDDGQDEQERAYEGALSLLGLSPGFSRTALHSAWKAAIRLAHPDAGGAVGQAQAINAARDLIAARHGWK